MKKIQFTLLIAGISALLFTACKSKDTVADDPKVVITTFFERMAKKDIEGAAKLCTKESQSTLDLIKKGMDAAEKMGSDTAKKEEDDFKDMVIGDAKVDGDKATVSVLNKKENKSVDFPLKREGGSWKVDFTMATLMKMGMDEAGKSGEDPFKDDSLKDTITNELDKAVDTLKQELEENKQN